MGVHMDGGNRIRTPYRSMQKQGQNPAPHDCYPTARYEPLCYAAHPPLSCESRLGRFPRRTVAHHPSQLPILQREPAACTTSTTSAAENRDALLHLVPILTLLVSGEALFQATAQAQTQKFISCSLIIAGIAGTVVYRHCPPPVSHCHTSGLTRHQSGQIVLASGRRLAN